MLNFLPYLGKLSKNAVFEAKIAMVCIVNLPLLAVLMHLYHETPAMVIGFWLFACLMLTGELYALVLKVWVIQVVFTTKVLRMRVIDMDRALGSGGQTSVQTLDIDVKKRTETVTKEHVPTQTAAPCTFREYTSYVLHVMKQSHHFSIENWDSFEAQQWTARLVVLMHSKMHYHVCRMIAACAVAYLIYGAFHVEWRALVSSGMAFFANPKETTREDKPKEDPILMKKLLICMKYNVCKPTGMTF
jgi:hypothetical protein